MHGKSLGEVWDLCFNVGSNFKAKALSHLPVVQTGKSSILIRGVVLGLQQDDCNYHAMQTLFSLGAWVFFSWNR